MNNTSVKTGGGGTEFSQNAKLDLWTNKNNSEWAIGNTNRSVQIENISINAEKGYEYALKTRKLPMVKHSKQTVFALLAVPAMACATYYSDQPVFPMNNKSDLYAIEFVNTFVQSGNVYKCVKDESFKQRFLKNLGQGKFLFTKDWKKEEFVRPLTKKERYARNRLKETIPSFLVWLRESTTLKGQSLGDIVTASIVAAAGLSAVDNQYAAGAFFFFGVGCAIKKFYDGQVEQKISHVHQVLCDIMKTAGEGLDKAISVVEPDFSKFCKVTRSVIYAVYLAVVLSAIAMSSIIISSFLKSLGGLFGHKQEEKFTGESVAPAAIAAMLCAVVGADYKLGSMVRSFSYLYSITANVVKDVFNFEQYKPAINKICKYFGKPEPFVLADWCTQIDAYEDQYMEWKNDPEFGAKMVNDVTLPSEMRAFADNLSTLNRAIRGHSIVPNSEKLKVSRMHEWALTSLRDLAKLNTKFARRVMPLTLSIIGRPGIGKTEAVECLSYALYYKIHRKEIQPSEIYPLTDSKYFDAYSEASWWFHIPEFLGSATPLINEEAATLYRNIVGTDAIPLNCAALDKKDTVSFCSRLITDTGNRPNAYQKCGLSNHIALSRRVMFPLTVERGTLLKKCDKNNFDSAWKFTLAPDVVANPSHYEKKWHALKIGENYTFSEILDMLVDCYQSLSKAKNFSQKAVNMVKLQGNAKIDPISEESSCEVVNFPFNSTDSSEEESSEEVLLYPVVKRKSSHEEVSTDSKEKEKISSESEEPDDTQGNDSRSFSLGLETLDFQVKMELFRKGIRLSVDHPELNWKRLCMYNGKEVSKNYDFGTVPDKTKNLQMQLVDDNYVYNEWELTNKYKKLAPILYLYFNQGKLRKNSVAIKGSDISEEFPQTIAGKFVEEDERHYYEYKPGYLAVDPLSCALSLKNCKQYLGTIQGTEDPCSLFVGTRKGPVAANVEDILKARAVLHADTFNGGVSSPIFILKDIPSWYSSAVNYGKSTVHSAVKWVCLSYLDSSQQWKLYAALGAIVTTLLACVAMVAAIIGGAFGETKTLEEISPELKAEGASYWYDNDKTKVYSKKRAKNSSNKVTSSQVISSLSNLKAEGQPSEDALRFGNNMRRVRITSESSKTITTWCFMVNNVTGYVVRHAAFTDTKWVEVLTMDESIPTRLIHFQNFQICYPSDELDVALIHFKEPMLGVTSLEKAIMKKHLPGTMYSRMHVISEGKNRGITLTAMKNSSVQLGPTAIASPNLNEPDFMVSRFHFIPDHGTTAGFCGLPYVSMENGTFKISGIHFAGSPTFAAFHELNYNIVQDHVKTYPFKKFSANCPPAILSSLSSDFKEREGLINLGKLTTVAASTPKSRVKLSPLVEVPSGKQFPSSGMRPATLVGPTASRTFKFGRKGVILKNDMLINFVLNKNVLKGFVPPHLFHNMRDPNELQLEDLLFGAEGHAGLSDKTSVGPMYKRAFHPSGFKPKDKKELFCVEDRFISKQLRDDFEERIKSAEKGEVLLAVVERSLKEEVRSIEEKGIYRIVSEEDTNFVNFRTVKNKEKFIRGEEELGNKVYLDIEPREFYPTDPIDILEAKSILWPILEKMHMSFMETSSVVGINPVSSAWKILVSQIIKPGWKPIFFDVRSCDKTIPEGFWVVVFNYFQSICQYEKRSPKWYRLRAACWKMLHFVYFAENFVYIIDGTNPSGQWLTCLLNGLWIYFVYKTIFNFIVKTQKLAHKFDECVVLKTFGDDAAVSVSPEAQVFYNRHSISVAAHTLFNVVFTSLNKVVVHDNLDNEPMFDKWCDFEFLQRKVKIEGSSTLAPLRIDSIWRSLMWSSIDFTVESPVEHYKTLIPEALVEFALHGKDVFEDAVSVIMHRFQKIGGVWDVKWNYPQLRKVIDHRICCGCEKFSHEWK